MWLQILVALLFLVFEGHAYMLGGSNIFVRNINRMKSSAAASTTSRPSVDKVENTNQLMSFGSKMAIKIPLPTRDPNLAKAFLSNTDGIVQSTWDKGKFDRLGDGSYLLKFASLPIPGVDTISPEIEVVFINSAQESSITMKSGNWTLKGQTGTIKDSRFMKTFNIELDGMIAITPSTNTQVYFQILDVVVTSMHVLLVT
jgi:hypothetical protein